MKKKGCVKIICRIVLLLLADFLVSGIKVSAGSVYDSAYVTFSPDGAAFTTNAYDTDYEWYEEGEVVNTGIVSTYKKPGKGEHTYLVKKEEVSVGNWVVTHGNSSCCHNNYPPVGAPYHGVEFGRQYCLRPYYSGWTANCADCGEQITSLLFYMSREAAVTLKHLDLTLDYYYICPYCSNLEQGSGLGIHYCKAVSWNRYQVRYDSNTEEWVGGYMEHSLHMYNNETIFEGERVTPQTRLSPNTYTRIGYVFRGWNTKPDGSGSSYPDRAEIWNLTEENYDINGGGTVTLYAQWEPAESTLQIDPGGGTYCGQSGIVSIAGAYGSCLLIKEQELIAPKGSSISFQTNGGKPVDPVTGGTSFAEWSMIQPFYGKLKDNTYYFLAEAGKVDTIKAIYRNEPVILPTAQKAGSSFGGWYYDRECTLQAGVAGDEIVAEKDLVLYAKWVDLVLHSEDNYAAHEGVGAVDLTWEQKDGKDKTYQLYQSRNQKDWILASGVEDITNSRSVNRKFTYSGASRTYTVPYTGLYTITVNGAQGADYGQYSGGAGGIVTGDVWLTKGEVLTYTIGGKDGFHNGGKATVFANGGGATRVSSNLKGILFIAGGGGGATSLSPGGAGGSQAGVRKGESKGEAGAAGGGGGYFGGMAGEVEYHYHSASCYVTEDNSYVVMSAPDTYSSWAQSYANMDYDYHIYGPNFAYRDSVWGVYAHGTEDTSVSSSMMIGKTKNKEMQLIPVKGNQKLNLHLSSYAWGVGGIRNGSLTVYDQNNKVIYNKALSAVTRYSDVENGDQDSIRLFYNRFEQRTGGKKGSSSGWYSFYLNVPGEYIDRSCVYWNETVDLPAETTGVRIGFWTDFGVNGAWMSSDIQEISFSGSRKIQICEYAKDGQLVSAKAAYGGSSYVNTEYVKNYHMEKGKNTGNGDMKIQSVSIGYLDIPSMKGLIAADCAAPGCVMEETVKKTVREKDELLLQWECPEDRGTVYYHKVQSYLTGSSVLLSESNITRNELTTGVAGYRYLVDSLVDTTLDKESGNYTKRAEANIILTQDKQYFHVAAVDKAGNLGETLHVQIGRADEEVAWPLLTERIEVDSEQGVVFEKCPGIYYVRCDNHSPFLIRARGWMNGAVSKAYQINHIQLEMEALNEETVVMDMKIPHASQIVDTVLGVPVSEITKSFSGQAALTDALYTQIHRSKGCRVLTLEQKFYMSSQMDGMSLTLIPRVGADFRGELIMSDRTLDAGNGVTLIGDNRPPVLKGMEELERYLIKQETDGEKSFLLEAEDDGSGVADFYVVVMNQDNGGTGKFSAENGQLTLTISEENSLFQGDYVLEVYAIDHVGNRTVSSLIRDFFAVTARVEKILEPEELVFRGGESGKIFATAYGYVDCMEIVFPDVFTVGGEKQKLLYEYNGEAYRQEEEIVFTVPLDIAAGEYQFTVIAWKDEKIKNTYPVVLTFGEEDNILKDIRTRLR